MSSTTTTILKSDKTKNIFLSLDHCLTPFTAYSSSQNKSIQLINPDISDINEMITSNYSTLLKNLKQISFLGYCWICDKTSLYRTYVIQYEILKRLINNGPVKHHSREQLDFETLDKLIGNSSVCIDCCLKSLLTAYPVSSMTEMINRQSPYILGKIPYENITIQGMPVSIYHECYIGDM
ncbi:TPA_asm: protein 3 [Triticum virus 1]|uniref:Protein 3 n=1 Tax=Triticum virus 1 TaxID=2977997 RepID=A0A9N6YJK8_9RHAB|nr:TPA_asm: protein 3 [Triticum virus 1]